jgi:predicted phosphodiesterase
MKVAILADIHSNLYALQRVVDHMEAWRPDVIIMGGDVINRGPHPQACMEVVERKGRSRGWQMVRGNHEDYVLTVVDAETEGNPEIEIIRNALWTYEKLNGRVDSLRAMPFQVSFPGPDGHEFRVVHASMLGNRVGIFPKTTEDRLRQQIAPPPPVLCVGHTHRPLVRTIDDTLVVNVGSVGMPFDGDRRAGYAQLTWNKGAWHAEIIRLAYEWRKTEADFFHTGFLDEAGDLAQVMLLELREARSYIHLWIQEYQEAVLSGEISMADSVRGFLSHYQR